jgi:hypothetical protein
MYRTPIRTKRMPARGSRSGLTDGLDKSSAGAAPREILTYRSVETIVTPMSA